jgi:hypothetical protein
MVTENSNPLNFEPFAVSFDPEAFDNLIRNHGIRMEHYRAMRNPVGMVDQFDSRRPNSDHSDASNGFLYSKAGCVIASLLGNTKDVRAAEGGQLSGSTAQCTPLRFYVDSDEQVYLHPYDRLYLEDSAVLVSQQELVKVSATGIDRTRFPICRVQDLVDARGVSYKQGKDFSIDGGKIRWLNSPEDNAELNTGTVYAVRYLYRPYWIVERLLHEIRVAQVEDDDTGDRRLIQMPQSAIVVREHVFRGEKNDPEAPTPDSQRQAEAPQYEGFGPR